MIRSNNADEEEIEGTKEIVADTGNADEQEIEGTKEIEAEIGNPDEEEVQGKVEEGTKEIVNNIENEHLSISYRKTAASNLQKQAQKMLTNEAKRNLEKLW